MAKIKSTLTGGSGRVNHNKANDHIRHREDCVGTTRDGTHVFAQVNSRHVNTLVESASLRETSNYDWKTGKITKKKLDVVENARQNMAYLNVHPVTNARAANDGHGHGNGGADCSPMAIPCDSVSSRWGRK